MACDPKLPRCQAINGLLQDMKYEEAIAEVQMNCRGRAAAMHPDNLRRNRPSMLMGLLPEAESWSMVLNSYDTYLDEACGGPELVYLILAGYQVAWESRTTGEHLGEVVKAVKTSGKDAVKEDSVFVSAEVNRVIAPMLASMSRLAESNYGARIKGIIAGDALEIVKGGSCSAKFN
jgi:hypothetical protein